MQWFHMRKCMQFHVLKRLWLLCIYMWKFVLVVPHCVHTTLHSIRVCEKGLSDWLTDWPAKLTDAPRLTSCLTRLMSGSGMYSPSEFGSTPPARVCVVFIRAAWRAQAGSRCMINNSRPHKRPTPVLFWTVTSSQKQLCLYLFLVVPIQLNARTHAR